MAHSSNRRIRDQLIDPSTFFNHTPCDSRVSWKGRERRKSSMVDMMYTIVWRLICSLESIVILCGLVYLCLFIYNSELLVELKVMVLGESFRSKVTRKGLELPPELAAEKTMQVLGKEIPNPMGALENLNDPAVQKYLHLQQEATDDFVEDKLSNIMKSFYDRYKTAINYENLENPICFGQTYFFFKRIRPELQQYSLFATKDLNQEASLVFDPNTIRFASMDSTSTDITDGMPFIHATWISDDGHRMAYGYTDSIDSRTMTIRVRDLRQRKDLSVDLITNCCVDYTSVAWIDSRTGFFYTTQVPTANISSPNVLLNRLMFHRVGTAQEEDFMVFETVTNFDNVVIQPRITSDGHYLLLEIFRRKREASYQAFWRNVITEHSSVLPVGNKVYYYDLSKFDGTSAESIGPCIKLIDTFSFRFDYISNIEEDFWFRTNYRAPNFRVVRITLPNIDVYNEDELVHITFQLLNAWKQCLDWIPQRVDGDYLESANIAAHTVMVLKYLRNSSHEVLLYDLTQNLLQESQIPVADLPHPPYGTITGPNCNFYSAEIFYQFSDFSEASSIYRVLIDRHPYTGTIEISFHEVHSTIIPSIDKYAFTTIQETCETKRNIYVPMLISGLRDVLEDDNRGHPKPCIVCVHGGFGMPLTPKLSLPFLLFAQVTGGIVVTINVQGAGIYGTSYAEHGRKEEKEFAVLDLAYVLRFLVKKRYTTHHQIALFGGTFNGTLIASAMVQFPSLFASAVIYDGIFDLLRYQLYNPPEQCQQNQAANKDGEATTTTWQERSTQFAKRPWSHWTSTIWYQEFGGCFPSEASISTTADTANSTGTNNSSNSNNAVGVQTPPSTPSSTVKPPQNTPNSSHKPVVVRPHQFSSEEFQAHFLKLSAMSPLHQVGKPVAGAVRTCPAVLIIADYCDDKNASISTTIASKVSCIHSVKFAAQLQKCYYTQGEVQHEQQQQQNNKPILLHLVGLETSSDDKEDGGKESLSVSESPNKNHMMNVQQRVAVATLSMEEICRIFAFMIHTIQAPWPVSAHTE